MEKTMFQDLSPEERIDHFNANCDGVETKVYQEPLSVEEIQKKRTEFIEKGIEIARVEDDKKEAMEEFKSRLDPLKSIYKNLLEELNTGQQEKEGRVFMMVDRDNRQVGFYSEEGNLIMQRPATHEEVTQLSLKGLQVK